MKESNEKIIKIKEGKPERTETRKKKEKKKENSLKNISTEIKSLFTLWL